jgi:hypothetical protein
MMCKRLSRSSGLIRQLNNDDHRRAEASIKSFEEVALARAAAKVVQDGQFLRSSCEAECGDDLYGCATMAKGIRQPT